MKNRIPLIVAVVMGIIAVILCWEYIQKVKKEARVEMEMVRVLVAAKNIHQGQAVDGENLAAREYPKKYVGDRAIRVEQAAAVVNSRAKVNLAEGRPIFWSDLTTPSDMEAGLSGLLDRNSRAVTIPVTEVTGVAGFIRPDDRVDIFYTFNIQDLEQGKDKDQGQIAMMQNPGEIKAYVIQDLLKKNRSGDATTLLLQNVLVLATGSADGGGRDRSGGRNKYGSLTLRVNEDEALLLAYCMDNGKLALALRNRKYPETDPRTRMVTAQTLAQYIEEEVNAKATQGNQ